MLGVGTLKTLMKLRKLSSSLVEVYDISPVSGVSPILEISELIGGPGVSLGVDTGVPRCLGPLGML